MADEPNRQELIEGVQQWMDRFWEKVQKTDDHWLWTGALDKYGYGVFGTDPASERREQRGSFAG